MREKDERLVPCPIARSSNNDAYNDLCKATGKPCPYFIDEGMSVCKSKIKCLTYFSKRWSSVNRKQVLKLILSDTKSDAGVKSKYTNTIRHNGQMQEEETDEFNADANQFVAELEAALKSHEVSNEESEDDT